MQRLGLFWGCLQQERKEGWIPLVALGPCQILMDLSGNCLHEVGSLEKRQNLYISIHRLLLSLPIPFPGKASSPKPLRLLSSREIAKVQTGWKWLI